MQFVRSLFLIFVHLINYKHNLIKIIPVLAQFSYHKLPIRVQMQFKLLKHTNFLVISESILVKQADIYKPYNLYNILRKTSLDNVLRVFVILK